MKIIRQNVNILTCYDGAQRDDPLRSLSLTTLSTVLCPVYTIKQTWSKLRAHVVHDYVEYVCFIC